MFNALNARKSKIDKFLNRYFNGRVNLDFSEDSGDIVATLSRYDIFDDDDFDALIDPIEQALLMGGLHRGRDYKIVRPIRGRSKASIRIRPN
jgi:hypothetical protein